MFANLDAWAGLWKLTAWGLLAWLGHLALSNASPRWRMWTWRLGALGCLWIFVLGLFPSGLEWTIDYTKTTAAPAVPENPPVLTPAPAERRPELALVRNPEAFEGKAPLLPSSALLPPEQLQPALRKPEVKADSTADLPPSAVTTLPPAPQLSTPPVSAGPRSTVNWTIAALVIGYISVVLLLAIRMLVGLVQAKQLIRNSSPAPAWILDLAREFARRL